MDPISIGLLVASMVTGVGTALYQQGQMEEAQDIQNAAAKDQARQTQRQAIRERRIKMAQTEQASENLGVSESSGELGAMSSLSAQSGIAAGFAASQQQNIFQLNRIQQRSQTAGLYGAAAQSIFNVGMQYQAGKAEGLKNIGNKSANLTW